MSPRGGGGDCRGISCNFCRSNRKLHEIRTLVDRDDLYAQDLTNLIRYWTQLLEDPLILPFCYQHTGSNGFVYLVGRTYVVLNQYDFINLPIYSEETANLYYFKCLMDKVKG